MKTNLRTLFSHRSTRITLGVVAALLVAALIFHAGVGFGERSALDRMRGHTALDMLPPTGLFGIPLPHEFIPEGHGTIGAITAVASSTSSFTLQARDGSSVTIDLRHDTRIITNSPEPASTPTTSALTVGTMVVVVGEPAQDSDAGQDIDARIIHILPPPQQ